MSLQQSRFVFPQLWDDTVVVLWGDHGYLLGEHGGQWEKTKLWEEAIRTPLLFAAPGKTANAKSPRVVEFIDIYPTLVELCGLPDPGGLQGASLAPLLAPPNAPRNRPAFSVLGDAKTDTIRARSVRTERWHYVEYGDNGKGGAMLYDHVSDPHEYKNLAGDKGHDTTVQEMKRLLARSQGQNGDRRPQAEPPTTSPATNATRR